MATLTIPNINEQRDIQDVRALLERLTARRDTLLKVQPILSGIIAAGGRDRVAREFEDLREGYQTLRRECPLFAKVVDQSDKERREAANKATWGSSAKPAPTPHLYTDQDNLRADVTREHLFLQTMIGDTTRHERALVEQARVDAGHEVVKQPGYRQLVQVAFEDWTSELEPWLTLRGARQAVAVQGIPVPGLPVVKLAELEAYDRWCAEMRRVGLLPELRR